MIAKDAAREAVAGARDRLVDLSHRIHAHPELGFEEDRSCAWVAEALGNGGLSVTTGVGGLPTALTATAGSGPLTIVVCAEYDALPEVGHACGHNVIAAAAVGAALALAQVADDIGVTVRLVGTPAEEGGGGKVLLLDRGVFDGAHAAMMVHPSNREQVDMPCLAVSHLRVAYSGKAAHASAHPEQGINAADALTVAQVALGLLRQHIRDTDRIHGIVTHGGAAPNIVPAATAGRWYVRARTLAELAELEPRVRDCFEAGALATGARVRLDLESPPYSEMLIDADIAAHYLANATALGRIFPEVSEADRVRQAGSTDMANVSLCIPTIHPMLGIECGGSSNHQPEFAAWCAREDADRAVVDGATAMAWTAIDVAGDPALRDRLLASGGYRTAS